MAKFQDQGEYIRYIIEKHKKSVDKLIESGYNTGEISRYAKTAYYKERFDEVMTEYRVEKLSEGE